MKLSLFQWKNGNLVPTASGNILNFHSVRKNMKFPRFRKKHKIPTVSKSLKFPRSQKKNHEIPTVSEKTMKCLTDIHNLKEKCNSHGPSKKTYNSHGPN